VCILVLVIKVSAIFISPKGAYWRNSNNITGNQDKIAAHSDHCSNSKLVVVLLPVYGEINDDKFN